MKKLIYINLIFATLLFSTGCKKGFLTDLAVNPNQPSQAPASLILPPILTGYASNSYFSSATIGLWMGYYSISGGYSTDNNSMTYYVSAAGPSNWDNLYNILKNAAYIETNSASDPNGAYSVAAAKILKAFGFQILVDGYGNVPYSQAFQGSANFFPKYDNGQDIYDSSIAQLDNAINLIQNAPSTTTNLGSNDVMFGGDMTQWAKFANTLKLRYLIRQSNIITASAAQAEIAKTASVGYLTSDAMVNPGYLNTAGKQNPFWASYGTTPGGSLVSDGYNYLRAGGAAVNYFQDSSDTRLFYVYNADGSSPDNSDFFKINDNFNDYHGVYYGDRVTAAAQNNGGTAGLGLGVLGGYNASVPLMTAAESYFLQSEAALRGWISDDALSLLKTGVKSSYEFLYTRSGNSISNADAAAYIYDSVHVTKVDLKAIITQKWAALDGVNNFESWTEYRRTGFPTTAVLPLSKFPGNTRHIPTKLMYPTSEQNTNQDNYKAAVALGNDPQSTKVFWMK
ncbi:MAG TPA: SusD/RagB family nutrient-binding outer membrane lipoprotein [Hanamia sp.]|nr:SusD/RagB family nutrient-binding outer membrane lipoprotein [Hanamia sp.]